jgi:hypothetical protein
MAVSRDSRPSRIRTTLTAVLTVLVLVPTGILFTQSWQRNTDERDSTRIEQHGIEYLNAMIPLVGALAQAQSSALRGSAGSAAALSTVIGQVAAVDQRIGAELRVRERWNGLRTKIEGLAAANGDPVTAFQAYAEATDLALALCDSVRGNAELARDPDNDVSNLQQAVSVELPGTIAQAGRVGDLALLLGSADATRQRVLAPLFGAAALTLDTLVNSLTDNLQAAVDDTNSATLSGNLVTQLDGFRRSVETLTAAAGQGGKPNASAITSAQSQVQAALSALSSVLLRETSGLLTDRADRLDKQRTMLLLVAAAAVLLAIAALIPLLTGRRRRPDDHTLDEYDRDSDTRGGRPARDPRIDFSGRPSVYGEADPTRRERSGALR